MYFTKFASPLYLLIFILLLFKAASGDDITYHFCSSSEYFTTNDRYDTNLQELAGYLVDETPTKGFGIGSKGQRPYKVYGLALGRVDILDENCLSCVVNASKELRNRCPFNKAAIMWYDKCLFKYGNEDFFGQVDHQGVAFCTLINVSGSIISFNQRKAVLWSQLSNETRLSQNLYAMGSSELEGSDKLYGLSQCTRDISSFDCGVCLDFAFTKLSEYCDGKQGGCAWVASCIVRYEPYEFLNS